MDPVSSPIPNPVSNYASLLKRIGAKFIDFVILFFVGYLIGLLTGQTNENGFQLTGLPALLWFIISFGYFVILEAKMGATLGKMLLKIKVTKVDGSACGFGAAIIRNLILAVDSFPVIGIVGIIAIASSQKKQRLGDMAAHTIVISK